MRLLDNGTGVSYWREYEIWLSSCSAWFVCERSHQPPLDVFVTMFLLFIIVTLGLSLGVGVVLDPGSGLPQKWLIVQSCTRSSTLPHYTLNYVSATETGDVKQLS